MAADHILHLSLFAIAPSDFVQQDGYGYIPNVHPEDLAEPDELAPPLVRASPFPAA